MCWLQGEGIVTFSPRHLQQHLSIRAYPFGFESFHNHPWLLERVERVVSHVFFPQREPSLDPQGACPLGLSQVTLSQMQEPVRSCICRRLRSFLPRRRSRVQSDVVQAVWGSMIQLSFVDFPRCFLKLCWKYLCDLVTN